jgi:nitrogen fixation-related uncharacterized protein
MTYNIFDIMRGVFVGTVILAMLWWAGKRGEK